MEKLVQITSGKGPEECERVVFLLLEKMKRQAVVQRLDLKVIEAVRGRHEKTMLSALLQLSGAGTDAFCSAWAGTVLWTGQSPFRKFHKRKNWFAGITVYEVPEEICLHEKDIVYQTLRASGPGGQNVNKVESAVRATHLPSGISVIASVERSQLMNKKEATLRLKHRLLALQMEAAVKHMQQQWMEHNLLERGNPMQLFKEPLDQ